MTPFALMFMTVSMACVTCLAGFCLYRILSGGKIDPDDE
jgi:hypothetical protein